MYLIVTVQRSPRPRDFGYKDIKPVYIIKILTSPPALPTHYVYSPLASSRLACHAIQHIQPYSHTSIHAIHHTALYSLPLRGPCSSTSSSPSSAPSSLSLLLDLLLIPLLLLLLISRLLILLLILFLFLFLEI